LIIISCNNKTKAAKIPITNAEQEIKNGVDHTVLKMWSNFIQSNPEFKN